MEEKYRIYNDDCFTILQQLVEDGVQVDAIICDPPYIINYADWDKDFNLPLAIDMCYQLLKENGNLILFQGWSNVSETKTLLDEKFKIQNWIIWDRIKGRGAKKNFVSTREDILWYCKGTSPAYTKIYSNIPKKTGGLGKKMDRKIVHLQMYGMIFHLLYLGVRKEMDIPHKNHCN